MQLQAERIPQPYYHLYQDYKPYMNEISCIKIPKQDDNFDWSWLYYVGEVIVKVECSDGVVVLLRNKIVELE